MIEPLSQTAKAFRDTTISNSLGAQFRAVTALYGLPYNDEVPLEDWREGVKVMAFGARGTPGTTLAWIEAITASWGEDFVALFSGAEPNRIYTSGNPYGDEHVGRWFRLANTGGVHMVIGVDAGGSYVDFCPIATAYWTPTNFTTSTFTTATLLPFTIMERGGGPGQSQGLPGLVEATLYVNDLLPPATYMQPGAAVPGAPGSVTGDASYNGGSMDPVPNASPLIGADPRAGGQPHGGHVQSSVAETGDDGGAGPFPIYLSSGAVLSHSRATFEAMLASGIHVKFQSGVA